MKSLATIIVLGSLVFGSVTYGASPDIDGILASGKFDDGIVTVTGHLKDNPKDDVARFGLAAIQFVGSVQRLSQKIAAYGLKAYGINELKQMLGDHATSPEPLDYPRLRQITQEWIDDLAAVDGTLARIEAEDIKLPLHIARISLNLSRSGAEAITLIPFLQRFGWSRQDADLVIAFDRADVDWLRGYCHLLSALGELSLAYDAHELFDVYAHCIFRHVKTPYSFLQDDPDEAGNNFLRFPSIVDIIAAIHVIRFPLIEAKRCSAALEHLERTIELSRQMWKRILAETDNDREWIPGPDQRAAIRVVVSREMVDQWLVAMDECESILKGKKLLPFWRGKQRPRGVNLRKVFSEPRQFDLVLWFQGTAAAPYLEEGDVTRPDTWTKINEAFRGQFLTIGIWFN